MSVFKKEITLCLCVLIGSLAYAVPVNAQLEEELSFEMSDSFSSIDNSQDSPSFSKQGRLKFYDSNDGDWSAGLGVALIEPAAGDVTDSSADSMPAPFVNLQFKLGQ